MKTKLIAIILAVVFLVGAGSIIGVAAYNNSPKTVAIKAIENAIEATLEREEVQPLYNMLKGGSLSFNVSKIEEDGDDLLEGGSISGKLYFSQDALMLDDFKSDAYGIDVSGKIYLSDEMFYVSEDEYLGGAYGFEFDKLAKDFADSIFAYGSDSVYAIEDEEIYEAIIEALEKLDNEKIKKDSEKLLKKLLGELWKIGY